MGRKNKHRKGNGGSNESNWTNFSFEEDEENYLKSQTLNLRPFLPRSNSQKMAYDIVKENVLTFLGGPAGTSKTNTLCRVALEYLDKGLVKKIVVTRPALEASKSIGFLPGSAADKLEPYLIPIYDNFEVFITPEKLKQLLETKTIEIVPIGFARGRTFNNAFVIVDESQNLSKKEAYLMLTRIGFDSYMGLTFDDKQIDLKPKEESFIFDMDRLEGGKNIGFFEFGLADVIRSEMAKEIVRLYEETEDY